MEIILKVSSLIGAFIVGALIGMTGGIFLSFMFYQLRASIRVMIVKEKLSDRELLLVNIIFASVFLLICLGSIVIFQKTF